MKNNCTAIFLQLLLSTTLSPLVLFYTLFRLYRNPSYFTIDTSLIPCLTPLTPLANAQALLQHRAALAKTEKS